ncbi:MAG: LLM class F420-dependent oxidoreductase [Anaerolineae bacterium]|uniref:LLM class F420-dependent oxidoreductase n=1 Tax=Promineifilum sp. TaxID=2664178 RepID=UPI002411E8F3|nr:LLM class F420-dependent oxidoreductase [Promineifilum sp.]MCO5180068.1 LLM class F420-dependent oxidoreductase [Promineifilum sp.]MCW5845744.1 LLM class F420-dependent oxidoreductase [Anaerolineae bacterium]
MRLGLMLGYAAGKLELPIELVREADRLGIHAVWTAEAYGSDAVTPLAWLGALTERIKLGTAIMQMPGRTPANAAMTAMTFNQLSGGRFLMGLGLSGPQVVEGWHGVSYAQPLARTREYVEIVRRIFRREAPLTFEGKHYQIPYHGEDATGLGKPLKSTLVADANIPIYLAAIGPKNVELAAEIADGWLPIFFAPERYEAVFRPHVEAGLAKAGKSMDSFDIAPTVSVVINDNLDIAYNMLRPMLALYIGGMGARGKNFYNDLAGRYGFEDAAAEIQNLYLSGDKGAAMARVPAELIDAVALVGPRERVRERLAIWRGSPVTTLNMTVFDSETLRTVVELVEESA